MRQNGSPEPIFESGEDRTWFLVRLPVHERALLAAIEQDTDHDTVQDKSLINKKNGQDTLHDSLHDTLHDTEHVERLIVLLTGEMSRSQLQEAMKLQDRSHFSSAYLEPALKAGLIEMTLPDKPKSRKQQYRRTAQGEALAEQIKRKNAPR